MWRKVSEPLRWYSEASKAAPLSVAFATCFVKGSAADALSQFVIEKSEALHVRRNAAFATFSGAYLGIGQHFVYNEVFTRAFGPGRDARTALAKVAADSLVHVPVVYLPLYFAFEYSVLSDGPLEGLKRYSVDAPQVLSAYWSLWPPLHFVSFTVVPPQLRIGFVATVSFVWLTYLSFASHG